MVAVPPLKSFSLEIVQAFEFFLAFFTRCIYTPCQNDTLYQCETNEVVRMSNQTFPGGQITGGASNPILAGNRVIHKSDLMKQVMRMVDRVAPSNASVLVLGESGTGKELLAHAIHSKSQRRDKPFVAINCGALRETLLESELFGHEKGAFTDANERKIGKFQLANNGTLFLDEIGELKPEVQSKLLRVLQDKSFMPVGSNRVQKTNARIVAATNQNLEKLIEQGQFREDLFFRLNVVPIFIPPLRDRREDIPSLLKYFTDKYSTSKNTRWTEEAVEKLQQYHWPGNIRELENVVQRMIILSGEGELKANDLPPQILAPKKEEKEQVLNFEKFKFESEKTFIEKALAANDGKINRTVANANIPKNTLLRKIKKFNIDLKNLPKHS